MGISGGGFAGYTSCMPSFPNMPSGEPNPRMMKRRVTGRWSPYRAWHGQEVDLIVETELIPDGTEVKITLLEEGEQDATKKIQEWSEKVDGCLCKKEKIKFDFTDLGYEGEKNAFYCKLAIEQYELETDSEVLTIDNAPFSFAG